MAVKESPLIERLLAPGKKHAESRHAVSTSALIQGVKEGFAAKSFDLLCEAYDVPRERICQVIGIPVRTLARRTVFKPDESERILRLGRLFQRATAVLGSAEEARTWFQAPQHAFGGIAPLDYADTELGAREVENLLGQLEHGVFA
jgi:putative toxin-antitoxin system antitoxin component (TIGR02293 family)